MALYFDDMLIRGRDERMRGPTTVIRKGFSQNKAISQLSQDSSRSRSRSPSRLVNPPSSRRTRNSITFSKVTKEAASKHSGGFKNFKIKQISLPKVDLRRVQVSYDGRFVYCGKKQLKVLEKMGNQYGMMKVGNHVDSFVDLKVMKNGNVIVFDESTSDLIKYDENLKQVRRLQGQNTINLSKFPSDQLKLTLLRWKRNRNHPIQ
jgi:hypothetical protein